MKYVVKQTFSGLSRHRRAGMVAMTTRSCEEIDEECGSGVQSAKPL